MNNAVSQTLKEIIGRYGLSVYDDTKRWEGLLRDLCPDCKLEMNSLISVLKEGIPQELLKSANALPPEVIIPRLIKLSVENLGLSEDIARWSVETWASALGVSVGVPATNDSTSEKPPPADQNPIPPYVPEPPPPTKPTAKRRLNSLTLKRFSVLDTLQNPAVLLPLGVCVVSVSYLLVLSPIFGLKWVATALAGVSGVGSGLAYFIRYPREYARNSQNLTNELISEREQREQADLLNQLDTLRTGFVNIYSADGAKTLNSISSEYKQWESALDQEKSVDPLATANLQSQGGETLRTGLSILSDSLDLMKFIQMTGRAKLEGEIAATEREIALLRNDPNMEEQLRFKQEIILSSRKEHLKALNQIQLYAEELLHLAGRCEASLRVARVELATIRAGNSVSDVNSVGTSLQERQVQIKEMHAKFMQKAWDLLKADQRQP